MSDTILANVGGMPITSADVDAFLAGLGQRGQSYNNPQGRAVILEQLIGQKLFLMDATRNLYEAEPAFKAELKRTKEMLLTNYAIEKAIGNVRVTEEEAKKFYDENSEQFMGDETTDFTVQLQKCKDAGADLVFLPFYYSQAILVLQQAADMSFAPIFFGGDGMDGILDVEGFDAALAENLMYMAPFAPTSTDEKIVKFVTAYQEAFDGVPNQFAADAYDGVYAIKAAMEAKDVTPEMSASEVCDLLVAAMVEIELDTAVTADVLTWGADGEPVKAPMVVKVSNGEYVVAE